MKLKKLKPDGSLCFHGNLQVVHTLNKTSQRTKFAYREEGQFLRRNPTINLELAVQARSLLAGL
jgi:hypothetical protein